MIFPLSFFLLQTTVRVKKYGLAECRYYNEHEFRHQSFGIGLGHSVYNMNCVRHAHCAYMHSTAFHCKICINSIRLHHLHIVAYCKSVVFCVSADLIGAFFASKATKTNAD